MKKNISATHKKAMWQVSIVTAALCLLLSINVFATPNMAKVRVLWDVTNLYLAFEITDSQIENPVTDPWNQDAIELYIDAVHNMTTTIDADDYLWIITAANVATPYYTAVGKTIQKAVVATGSGYNVEMAIPWAQISITPVVSKVLGALFANDDRDDASTTTFDWMNIASGGYARPNLWGDLTLSNTEACAASPVLTVNPTSMAYGTVTINTTSAEQTYLLTGNNLTANVTVTAPTGYQVSKTTATGFASSVSVTQTGGSVSQTIYARFSPTAVQAYNGNISNVSSGATTQNVAVTGSGIAGSGVVSGTCNSSNGNVNLTTVGTADWAHYYTTFDHKSSGGSQISNYSIYGGGTPSGTTVSERLLSWTGGTPTATATNTGTSIAQAGIGYGFSITAPADLTSRTLYVHASGWYSGGTLTATLSDGSATPYTYVEPYTTGMYYRNFAITYNAGSAAKILTVTWVMSSGDAPNSVQLSGAALVVNGTPTPALTVNPTSRAFESVTINTTSAEQTYLLTGSNLTANVTVTAPTGYQVSKTAATGFASSVSVTQTGGSVSQTIYARFTPTAVQAYNGNISNVSLGATTQNVAVTGSGVAVDGVMSGTCNSSNGNVNLTTVGTADWAHYYTTFDHKSSGGSQISNYSIYGGGTPSGTTVSERLLSWTGGTPTATATNTGTSIAQAGVGYGFSITAPADLTSRTLYVYASGWYSGGTLTATLSDGSATPYTYVVPYTTGMYYKNFAITYNAGSAAQILTVTWVMSSGEAPNSIQLSGAALALTSPVLTVDPTSLATYGNVTINTTSAEKTYLLTGSNLTANVTVTAPTGYQVSKTAATGFASSVSVTQTGGSVSQTIYARFTPTAVQAYNGNISNVSSGATTQNVAVTGSGVGVPALTVAPTSLATYGNVTVNATSTEQTYLLTGSNLTANVTVTAPTGYAVSKTTASGFATSVSVTQSGGSVNQTIYVQLTPTLVQAYNGNITNVSTGATTQNVALTGSGVNAFVAKKAIAAITINGSLSDWATYANSVTFTNATYSNNTVKVSTLWDNTNLYLAYEITDSQIENPVTDPWVQDAVELYIDAGHEKSTTIDANDYQFIITALNSNPVYYYEAAVGKTIQKSVATNGSGYIVEIAIPWAQIGKTPTNGLLMGALFANDDRDGGITNTFDWKNLIESGGYKRPNLWGDIILSDLLKSATIPTVLGTIDNTEKLNVYPNPANEFLSIELEGISGKQQIDIFNSTGSLVKVVEVTGSTQVDISGLSNGLYFVHLKNYSLKNQKFIKQ